MTTSDRDFVNGQDTKVAQIRFAVLAFQKLLVDGLDRFPVQVQMLRDFSYRHDLTQLINIVGQTSGNPDVRIKQLQILGANFPTHRTEQLSVSAIEPHLGGGKVQVPDLALCPAMSSIDLVAAFVTHRLVAPTRDYLDGRGCSIRSNMLSDNFYSTKGKVRCYGESGHRRSPRLWVFLGR